MRTRSLLLVALAAATLAAARVARAQDDRYERQTAEGIRLLEAKDYDGAIAAFERCLAIDAGSSLAYYNLACAYSLKGAKPEAIGWLEKALEHGFRDAGHIARDTDLDPIRGEPGFQALMAKHFGLGPPPPGRLFTLTGDEVDLPSKTKGEVCLVLIWRSWALPCRDALPALNDVARDLGPKGLVVIAVSDEPAAAQNKAAEELKIGPIVMLRSEGPLAPREAFEGVRDVFPTFVVVGRDGKTARRLVGERSAQELEAAILPLLSPARGRF
jgi:tetratricopeptide (TPR) repeat protein